MTNKTLRIKTANGPSRTSRGRAILLDADYTCRSSNRAASRSHFSANRSNGVRSNAKARDENDDRQRSTTSGDETDVDDDHWEVEKIMNHRRDSSGKSYYLLKWKNWRGDPTWEPESNLSCDRLLETYKQSLRNRPSTSDGRYEESPPLRHIRLTSGSPSDRSSPAGPRRKSTPRRASRR